MNSRSKPGPDAADAPPLDPLISDAVLTVESKINLIAPARGDALQAVGRVLKAGRTLTVCQLEVFAEPAQEMQLVAVGQQTLICLKDPDGGTGVRIPPDSPQSPQA